MKHVFVKKIVILLAFVFMFTSCALPYRTNYEQIIVSRLNNKYGLSFKVTAIKENYENDELIVSADCVAQEGPYSNSKFNVKYYSDRDEVFDNYINFEASKKFSQQIEEIFDGDCLILSTITVPNLTNKLSQISDYTDLLKVVDNYYITSYIFVESNEFSDTQLFYINDYAGLLSKMNLKQLNVVVFYYYEINENQIKNIFYQDENKYQLFSNDVNLLKRIGFQITDGKLETNIIETYGG